MENLEHILVVEFDYAFATGPKISMMVGTDSIHGSTFAVVARRKGGQDDYVMQSLYNYIDWFGFGQGRVEV